MGEGRVIAEQQSKREGARRPLKTEQKKKASPAARGVMGYSRVVSFLWVFVGCFWSLLLLPSFLRLLLLVVFTCWLGGRLQPGWLRSLPLCFRAVPCRSTKPPGPTLSKRPLLFPPLLRKKCVFFYSCFGFSRGCAGERDISRPPPLWYGPLCCWNRLSRLGWSVPPPSFLDARRQPTNQPNTSHIPIIIEGERFQRRWWRRRLRQITKRKGGSHRLRKKVLVFSRRGLLRLA